MIVKDTKTHQMRRVSIDQPTVELLREYKYDCAKRMLLLKRFFAAKLGAGEGTRATRRVGMSG